MGQNQAVLELSHVSKTYPAAAGTSLLKVLDGVELSCSQGDSIAIVGPSGCGKSTLLNIIGTLDKPTGGKVSLNNQPISGLSERELAQVRNRALGFIFQSHHLMPQLTVLENVLVPALPNKSRDRKATNGRARQLLQRVGLGERLDHRPGQLSGGERQRVAVVRALINQPALVLADEPTGALDRASADNLGQLLVDLNHEENVTLVVVTHALDLARRMKRVFELRDGRLRPLPPEPSNTAAAALPAS